MKAKNIVQRLLNLNTTYTFVEKTYIPIIDGGGCICENCNRIISNIAVIKNTDGQQYHIGFDCLETIMFNNQIIEGVSVEDLKKQKSVINKIIKFAKTLSKTYENNKNINVDISGFAIEEKASNSFTDYLTYYYLDSKGKIIYNENTKFKGVDSLLIVKILKNIFGKDILIRHIPA